MVGTAVDCAPTPFVIPESHSIVRRVGLGASHELKSSAKQMLLAVLEGNF